MLKNLLLFSISVFFGGFLAFQIHLYEVQAGVIESLHKQAELMENQIVSCMPKKAIRPKSLDLPKPPSAVRGKKNKGKKGALCR